MCAARQDLSKHKTEVVNLLAMVDTFNNLVANEPSIPTVAYPATNADVQSVLHNNRSIFALLVFSGLTIGQNTLLMGFGIPTTWHGITLDTEIVFCDFQPNIHKTCTIFATKQEL